MAEVIYFSRVLKLLKEKKSKATWLISGIFFTLANRHQPQKLSAFHVVEQNATVSGTVYYDGVITGPAYVWALKRMDQSRRSYLPMAMALSP